MTRKIYRTAQGKIVDLGALQLQNENIRAVGNMGVNARGDLIDSGNRPIDTRSKQVARQYNRQVSSKSMATPNRLQNVESPSIPVPPEDFEDNFVKPSTEAPAAPSTSGLAAAIAKARQIKQEPMKTPKEIAQEQFGIKKI